RLSPEDHSSRWYPGAGIYRNVWLDITGPVHVPVWGAYVTTPQISAESATVSVQTELVNRTDRETRVTLRTSILDASDAQVTRAQRELTIPPNGTTAPAQSLTVRDPHRWDVDAPYLYSLVSEVLDTGRIVDRYTTPFGIRSIAFDKDTGFSLNGRR